MEKNTSRSKGSSSTSTAHASSNEPVASCYMVGALGGSATGSYQIGSTVHSLDESPNWIIQGNGKLCSDAHQVNNGQDFWAIWFQMAIKKRRAKSRHPLQNKAIAIAYREAFFAHHDPLDAKAFGAHDVNMDLQSLGMILRVAPSNKPVELKAANESLNQIAIEFIEAYCLVF
ncbi:hypothetical protein DM860_013773 [Cuscuta australis]|uniref:Uncharacterized protein n=1 Tax=Cuscuta australis TaxID=267555 RepID=A0A328DI03_9ASTE|nr:hypothetical protein DM860_013773 [Cuscuta australis]